MTTNVYVNVESVPGSIDFFCKILQLFTVQRHEEMDEEAIVSCLSIPDFKLVLRASTTPTKDSLFLFSIRVDDCKPLFDTISALQPNVSEWQVSKEFFGTYLSSPIGDQFAIRNHLGVGILFYSSVTSN